MLGEVRGARQLALGMTAAVLATACSFDWASLDPRETGRAGAATGTPATGAGGTGTGMGGDGGGTSSGSPTGTASGTTGTGAGMPSDCLIPLQDPFDAQDPALWDYATSGVGCSTSVFGELDLACGLAPRPREALATTQATYDLSSCGVLVRLAAASLQNDAEAAFELVDGGMAVRFVLSGSTLSSQLESQSANIIKSSSFDAMDRWWRIRGEGGCVIWETAPDGAAWSLFDDSCAESLSTMQIRFRLSLSDPSATAEVAFDDLNLP